MATRVLILGASGLLGRAMLRHRPPAVEVLAPGPEELPLEDLARQREVLRQEKLDRILLLAAWTAVDACEADPDQAFRINGILPGQLAREAARLDVPLCFLSTDYVFDGHSARPYREFDAARPLSVYGRSKWHGECRVREAGSLHRIVRSAGLYGPGGPDFVAAILGRLRQGPIEVVTDEVNTPTFVDDLAPALWTLLLADERGTWHLPAGGPGVSRYDCARRIAELAGYDPALVRPTTHARLGRPAPRPPYSVLDGQAVREVFGLELPAWDDALVRWVGSGGDGGAVPPGSAGAGQPRDGGPS